jgi:hypothetical protein
LLKLPYPVSPSNNIGMLGDLSAINSKLSTTWVQEASLLSLTPNYAEILNPDPQIPLNPASYTIAADNPLWASMINSNSLDYIIFLRRVVLFT